MFWPPAQMAYMLKDVILLATFIGSLSENGDNKGCDISSVSFILTPCHRLAGTWYEVVRNTSMEECARLCRGDHRCRSATMDHFLRSCHLSAELPTAVSGGTNGRYGYLQKTCLPSTWRDGKKCQFIWDFESLPSTKLVGLHDERTVVEVTSRMECIQGCLRHAAFPCLSAEYSHEDGKCTLNRYNRFNAPKVVWTEKVLDNIEYLENSCWTEARGFCDTKNIREKEIASPDDVLSTLSLEECRRKCMKSSSFPCRTASFNHHTLKCSMSRLPATLLNEGGTTVSKSSDLLEISRCFDIAVDCQQDSMVVKVSSSHLFDGNVYAKGHPVTCRTDVEKKHEFTLSLPLTDASCGTQRMGDGTFTNVLIIQENDHIVTFMDKAIGVQCSYGATNITEGGQLSIWEEQSTDQKRRTPPLPELSLRVLDMQGNERQTVSLGEMLRVQVRMSSEETYGIFLRNLVATDGTAEYNVTLIDNIGCPVYTRMIREVRTIVPDGKELESYVEAFAFTGSNVLELEAEIDTCIGMCEPVHCNIPVGRSDGHTETVASFGRRRRTTTDTPSITVRLSRSVVVEADELTGHTYQGHLRSTTERITLHQDSRRHNIRPEHDEFCLGGGMTSLLIGIVAFFNSLLSTFVLVLWCRSRNIEDKERHLSVHYANGTIRPESDLSYLF